MISLLPKRRYGPIGVDIGTRSVKLLQLSADGERVLEASRWDLPLVNGDEKTADDTMSRLADALCQAREGKSFRGKEVVVCLTPPMLFLQNIRVPKTDSQAAHRAVQQEAAKRLPYSIADTDLQYLEAADVRQGDQIMQEVILLACERTQLSGYLGLLDVAGMRPLAVDVEPLALSRTYQRQFRRDEDRRQRAVYLHVGYTRSLVVIGEGDHVLFIKYIDIGGRQFDEAVAKKLGLSLVEASSLRRHNGDRRSDQRDPEVTRTVGEALRPVVDRLNAELSLCIRYHSVTFRGQPLVRLVLGGGESSETLLQHISHRSDLACQAADPLRSSKSGGLPGRTGQWDIAIGLALRNLE